MVQGGDGHAALCAAILAGGLGTRLRGVLDDRPKVLAPIRGRTFLDHLLDHLAAAGVGRVVLCLGHLAEQVVAHLRAASPPLPVACVVEHRPLGTAGALRLARPHLDGDPVLVVNGDTWVDFDLAAMSAAHAAAAPAATILAVETPDAARYGRLELDRAGRISAFVEKGPAAAGPAPINAGVYLLGASLLDAIAAGDATSLERDVLQALPAGALLAHPAAGGFIDIGTPETLGAADAMVGRRPGAAA